MNFESILPHLKNGQKVIRQGWSGAEEYVKLIPASQLDATPLNSYFVIKVTGEGYTMFTPTVCDILAEDWVLVD
ncbi:DUF2829 domain-containing protein [Eremococcus coleocola]|uniref:DUF2829 domain-containing protein n=1 Tax=Eremococcus coleocola TaxID=88132 RepID=UPI00040D7EAD|nr:DUF2829 domain-containing protein [Eremococcus coleocola]